MPRTIFYEFVKSNLSRWTFTPCAWMIKIAVRYPIRPANERGSSLRSRLEDISVTVTSRSVITRVKIPEVMKYDRIEILYI